MRGLIIGLIAGSGAVFILLAFISDPTQVSVFSRIKGLLLQAGYSKVSPQSFLLLSAFAAFILGLIGQIFTGIWVLSVVFALVGGSGPYAALRAKANKRQIVLRRAWPDAVDSILSGVRSGMSLPETLLALAVHGPLELREQLSLFSDEFRATGRFEYSLEKFKAGAGDPIADRIVEALLIANRVGGAELGALLRDLGKLLREDIKVRGEITARRTITVGGARLAVAAPWLILLLLLTKEGTSAAYATPQGATVLAVGAGTCALAYPMMLRIGRIREEGRSLA